MIVFIIRERENELGERGYEEYIRFFNYDVFGGIHNTRFSWLILLELLLK